MDSPVEARTEGGAAKRFHALDGLRGWASLMVVSFHFFSETFGNQFPEFRGRVAATLLNGPLSVAVFLVISGFVLTRGGWRNRDRRFVVRQIVKRYPRLTIPIAVTCCLVFVVAANGWNANEEAAAALGGNGRLDSFLRFTATPGGVANYSLIGVYMAQPQDVYQPFLWIMPIELFGSLVALVVCLVSGQRSRWPYLPLLALFGIGLVMPVVACFFIGVILALLHADSALPTLPRGRAASVVSALMLVVLMLLAAGQADNHPWWLGGPLVGAAVVYLALESDGFAWFLTTPVSRFLGRISFPLYLTHFLVLLTATSYLIIAAGERMSASVATGIGLMSVGLSVLVAVAFYPVEWATLRLCRWLGGLIR